MAPPKDFYEVQSEHKKKSLFLLLLLILFYFLAVAVVTAAVLFSLGFFMTVPSFFSPAFFNKFLVFNLLASSVIAFFHFQDARKFGAQFILKRLEAQPPDLADRYHKQFADTVEEIRIAAGLPKVKACVIPSFAINSMALVEETKTPVVAVTEGLLAECTRDELVAVSAHELAHIARGDAFYVTLVCSLANAFEKLRESLIPDETDQQAAARGRGGSGAPPVLIYVAVALSAAVMHLMSMLISREREHLADAAGVELSRDPVALARVIYKAHIKNSFVGDFSLTYSPIFIVPPDSREISDGFFSRVFNSHPPLMKRIQGLARMANKSPEEIIEQVREIQKSREQARDILLTDEERKRATGQSLASEAPASSGSAAPLEETADTPPAGDRPWMVRTAEGKWEGPYTIGEMISLPAFAAMIRVKHLREGIEAKAREFPQVRAALRNLGKKTAIDPSRENKCPRCRSPLRDTFYEGVAIMDCPGCGGKLVDAALMERILARKEVAFSGPLFAKAGEFKKKFVANPLKKMKIAAKETGKTACPHCGFGMVLRPYNYQYFIPVDKCLSCSKIWFDSDELEILQILIEKPAN